MYYPYSENKGAEQFRGSASLFSHMQKAGFLTTRLILSWTTETPRTTQFFKGSGYW